MNKFRKGKFIKLDIQIGVLFCKNNITIEDVYNEIFELFPMREETKRKYINDLQR